MVHTLQTWPSALSLGSSAATSPSGSSPSPTNTTCGSPSCGAGGLWTGVPRVVQAGCRVSIDPGASPPGLPMVLTPLPSSPSTGRSWSSGPRDRLKLQRCPSTRASSSGWPWPTRSSVPPWCIPACRSCCVMGGLLMPYMRHWPRLTCGSWWRSCVPRPRRKSCSSWWACRLVFR